MYSTIYWLTRLDYIQGFFIAIAVITAILSIVLAVQCFSLSDYGDDDEINSCKKWIRRVITTCVVASFISLFIPSKDDAILIIAGGKAYEYIQSDTSLQKIPFKSTEYLKLILEKQIQEIKK